jgi:zona occludens toxin (predicted ATPase)
MSESYDQWKHRVLYPQTDYNKDTISGGWLFTSCLLRLIVAVVLLVFCFSHPITFIAFAAFIVVMNLDLL